MLEQDRDFLPATGRVLSSLCPRFCRSTFNPIFNSKFLNRHHELKVTQLGSLFYRDHRPAVAGQ